MYGGGGQRARGRRAAGGGAGRRVQSTTRARAPRTLQAAPPMHRARVLHPFKFLTTSDNNNSNNTRPYEVRDTDHRSRTTEPYELHQHSATIDH